mmetsp:Transcript_13894/g.30487  ORF Transcript_13894/g.30487 Transcript_13894/m.30487 type:complete len:201 (-) Transcript_13894:18-620(-)
MIRTTVQRPTGIYKLAYHLSAHLQPDRSDPTSRSADQQIRPARAAYQSSSADRAAARNDIPPAISLTLLAPVVLCLSVVHPFGAPKLPPASAAGAELSCLPSAPLCGHSDGLCVHYSCDHSGRRNGIVHYRRSLRLTLSCSRTSTKHRPITNCVWVELNPTLGHFSTVPEYAAFARSVLPGNTSSRVGRTSVRGSLGRSI